MIDLTGAKVGEKFMLSGEQEVAVLAVNEAQVVFSNDEGFYLNSAITGKSAEGVPEFDVVGKHDPRPWLKDLPDADLFSDDVDYILCTERGWEFKLKSSFSTSDMTMVKMPVITSDQCKDSYITIVKLKAWQVENLPF